MVGRASRALRRGRACASPAVGSRYRASRTMSGQTRASSLASFSTPPPPSSSAPDRLHRPLTLLDSANRWHVEIMDARQGAPDPHLVLAIWADTSLFWSRCLVPAYPAAGFGCGISAVCALRRPMHVGCCSPAPQPKCLRQPDNPAACHNVGYRCFKMNGGPLNQEQYRHVQGALRACPYLSCIARGKCHFKGGLRHRPLPPLALNGKRNS